MKIRHAFLLALGIATPLWIRQLRFERSVIKHTHETHQALNETLDRYQSAWKATVREIERAFGVSKRRKVEL